MCGILGLVRAGGELDVWAVERGRDALVHRGPDGAGLWTRGQLDGARVALAHRRLSILDLSERGAQPLLLTPEGPARPASLGESGGGRLALTFNGEIYNYVELRDELRALGRTFMSDCDTEVLLLAYDEWGTDCLAKLNGMFAFALWDERRALLFCARDRFGEKPFHYVLDDARGLFAFASEVKGLVAGGFASAELEPRAVYRYFRFGEQAGSEETLWRGVRRLPAACALTVRATPSGLRAEQWRYWDLDPAREVETSDDDAVGRFRELFADSVRMRLRADVPVGTSLSGGLDSSSVICQIHALGAGAGQKAFTARMDDPAVDEGRYVDVVLERTGIPGYSVTPDSATFEADFDRLFYHQEEPFPTASIFASWLVSRLAREQGVIVMLDGQGADEFLAGYAHYPAVVLTDAARRGRVSAWWSERRAFRARTGHDPVPAKAALKLWLDERGTAQRELHVDAPRDAGFLAGDVREAFAGERSRTVGRGPDALKARLYADLTRGHLQELLRYADRNSMAWSREPRLPFLDHRLVEFCMALPSRLLFRGAESKWILRRAMRGMVPDAILDRTDKIGFVTPWERWWRGDAGGALRARLADAERSLDDLVEPGGAAPASAGALGIMAIASARAQLRALAPSPSAV